jgi:hypothetical protein
MPAAGLLAYGSTLGPAFPEQKTSSGIWDELAAYSCGGSRGFGPKSSPHSLLAPFREPPTVNS